jgi:hypothetical protein
MVRSAGRMTEVVEPLSDLKSDPLRITFIELMDDVL